MFTSDPAIRQIVAYFHLGKINASLYCTNLISRLCAIVRSYILNSIADLLPLALSVAGAILVVHLGWRLFRNFTSG